MSGAIAFAIFGKDNVRLFSAICQPCMKNAYEVELFMHCSLDIFDEKIPKVNELYLGHLFSDQKYKSYGFVTNSGVRMMFVLDVTNISIKDQDMRSLFKKFHVQYCNAISNPFYQFGDEINSKFLRDAAAEVLVKN